MVNYYEILGISPSSSAEQVKSGYTSAVLKAQGQPNFAEKFVKIQEAYDILSNPARRKAFDDDLLRYYTGKFNNVNNPQSEHQGQSKTSQPFQEKKESFSQVTDKTPKSKKANESIDNSEDKKTLKRVLAFTFICICFVVYFIFLFDKYNHEASSPLIEAEQTNRDIETNEFNGGSQSNYSNTDNNATEEVSKPINVDKILQDSINLVNAGYELRQLKNGAEPDCFNYSPQKSNIENKLEVYVGYGTDVAVKLIDKETENCIRYFYVNSGSTYTIRGIPQGIYYLKLAYGSQWMMTYEGGQCKGKFLRNARYEIGNEILDYNFKQTAEGHSVPSYRLQLGVSNNFDNSSNFRSKKIDEDQFNN